MTIMNEAELNEMTRRQRTLILALANWLVLEPEAKSHIADSFLTDLSDPVTVFEEFTRIVRWAGLKVEVESEYRDGGII